MVNLIRLIVILGLGMLFLASCSEPTLVPTGEIEQEVTATLTLEDPEPPEPAASPTPTATEEPKSTLDVGEEDIRGQVVRLWHPWRGEQAEVMERMIETFNASNDWGIEVQATGKRDLDQLWDDITAATLAGEAPEIAAGYLHQILALDASEPVVDLEVYMQDPIWGISQAEQADFYPVFWEADKIENKRFGLPALRSAHLIFYNSTWAKELGFSSPPATPDEYAEQACAAAQANLRDDNPENDGTGGAIISTHYSSTLGWLKAFGAPVVNDEQTAYLLDEPETETALGFLRKLYEDGCAWLPESDFTEVEFAAREGLFRTGTLTSIDHQAQAFARLENRDDWTVLPFPSPQETPAMPVYGPSYALLPGTPERQLAAWSFLRWLLQPENEAQWVMVNGSLPLRAATQEQLALSGEMASQWAAATDSLPVASSEPPFASWAKVRWALHDATTQLYRSYFTMEGIPPMVDFLQETAEDLQMEFD
jgi:multiple sugar transport system substrate-binding protein